MNFNTTLPVSKNKWIVGRITNICQINGLGKGDVNMHGIGFNIRSIRFSIHSNAISGMWQHIITIFPKHDNSIGLPVFQISAIKRNNVAGHVHIARNLCYQRIVNGEFKPEPIMEVSSLSP